MTPKPPFTYYGGKTTLAREIAEMLPPHEHYVEPFAGSLAVLLAKRPAPIETVNDLDEDLVTFWRVVREHPDELQRVMRLTPHSRAEYEVSRDLDVADEIERARRVWVRLTQGRSNSMQPHGWRYIKTRAGASRPRYQSGYADRLPDITERLIGVSLECRDALDVIHEYGDSPTSLLYVDPPYLGSARAANYRHEMASERQHRDLAAALAQCRAAVVLSGYATTLYAELFDGWHMRELRAPVALSNDTDRVEVLWSNRPLGEPDLFGESA